MRRRVRCVTQIVIKSRPSRIWTPGLAARALGRRRREACRAASPLTLPPALNMSAPAETVPKTETMDVDAKPEATEAVASSSSSAAPVTIAPEDAAEAAEVLARGQSPQLSATSLVNAVVLAPSYRS